MHSAHGITFFIVVGFIVIAFTAIVAAVIETQRARVNESALSGIKNSRAHAPNPANLTPADLKSFDGAQLMAALHSSSGLVDIDLDEIAYALEDVPSEPFLRYRARFSISTGYPHIRRFIDNLLESASNLSLDQISCVRQSVQEKFPTCNLSVSALYMRGGRG